MRSLHVWTLPLTLVLASACSAADPAVSSTDRNDTLTLPEITLSGTSVATHQGVGGNRFVAGQGQSPASDVSVVADDPISWVAGYAGGSGPVVVAVDAAGRVFVIEVTGEVSSGGSLVLPPGMPPLVVPALDSLVAPAFEGAARFNAPTLADDDTVLYVSDTGELVVLPADGDPQRVTGDALLDGRVTLDARGRALVLTEPTERYGHAVLGDAVEASGFAVVDVGSGSVIARHSLDPPAVYEAVVPMWADVDDDGEEEIVLTLSEPDGGARIVVYDADGKLLAQGPPIGRGFRWRHLIAAGPLGPEGETEIAVVRTPHIGGVLEMYRIEGAELAIVDSLTGPFGSHALGSRNLDMAIAGDFDGDGQPEVVLPSADRQSIVGMVHTAGGIEQAWRLELSAPLTSNLGAVDGPNGLVLIAGLGDGSVSVLVPG